MQTEFLETIKKCSKKRTPFSFVVSDFSYWKIINWLLSIGFSFRFRWQKYFESVSVSVADFRFRFSVSVAKFFWIGFGFGGWLSVSVSVSVADFRFRFSHRNRKPLDTGIGHKKQTFSFHNGILFNMSLIFKNYKKEHDFVKVKKKLMTFISLSINSWWQTYKHWLLSSRNVFSRKQNNLEKKRPDVDFNWTVTPSFGTLFLKGSSKLRYRFLH